MIKIFNNNVPLVINGIYFKEEKGTIALKKEYNGIEGFSFNIYGFSEMTPNLYITSYTIDKNGFKRFSYFPLNSFTMDTSTHKKNMNFLEIFKELDIDMENSKGIGRINLEETYYSMGDTDIFYLKQFPSNITGNFSFNDSIKKAHTIGKLLPIELGKNNFKFMWTTTFNIIENIDFFYTAPDILFLYRYHADCCGTTILNAFNESLINKIKLENFELYEIMLENIKISFKTVWTNHQYLAHLPEYKYRSIELLKEVGFKTIQKFNNGNSGNTIYTMSFVS